MNAMKKQQHYAGLILETEHDPLHSSYKNSVDTLKCVLKLPNSKMLDLHSKPNFQATNSERSFFVSEICIIWYILCIKYISLTGQFWYNYVDSALCNPRVQLLFPLAATNGENKERL